MGADSLADNVHEAVQEVLGHVDPHLTTSSLQAGNRPQLKDEASSLICPGGPVTSCTSSVKSLRSSHTQRDAMPSAVSLQSIVPTSSWEKIIDGAAAQQTCQWIRAEHPGIPENQDIAVISAAVENDEVRSELPQVSRLACGWSNPDDATIQVIPNH